MNILADSFSHVLGTPLKKTKIREIFINVGGCQRCQIPLKFHEQKYVLFQY